MQVSHHKTDIKVSLSHLVKIYQRIIFKGFGAILRNLTNIVIFNIYLRIALIETGTFIKKHWSVAMTVKNYHTLMQVFRFHKRDRLTNQPIKYRHHCPVSIQYHTLRMPLHTYYRLISGTFHSLNNSVWSHSSNRKALRNSFHRLVMKRIYL